MSVLEARVPARTHVRWMTVLSLVATLSACGDEETSQPADADTEEDVDGGSEVPDTTRPRDIGGDIPVTPPDVQDEDAADGSAGGDAVEDADASDGSASDVVSDADGSGDATDGSSDAADGSGPVVCGEACPRAGVSRCASGGVQTCTFVEASGCLEWAEPVDCGIDQRCEEGACVDGACVDECFFEGAVCSLDFTAVETCVDTNDDGCQEIVVEEVCTGDTQCNTGVCGSLDCTNDCAEGENRCAPGGGIESCGNYDRDPCREFGGPVTDCDGGEVCFGGVCGAAPSECLLISEYLEGEANNKAIELVNCGTSAYDLEGITFCSRQNSATSGCTPPVVALTGPLEPGETFSFCNQSASRALKDRCDVADEVFPIFGGNDRIFIFIDTDGDGVQDSGETIIDSFGDPARSISNLYENVGFRRCSTEAYTGATPFDVTTYYVESDPLDFSNIGVAPLLSGCD